MRIYSKLLAIVCFTFLLILAGQIHWKQQARDIAVYAESLTVSKGERISLSETNRVDLSLERLMISELLLDFEEQFVTLVVAYQDAVNEQFVQAEYDYYKEIDRKPENFRNFVIAQMNELDTLYSEIGSNFQDKYEELLEIIIDHGYSENDAILYYLLFEEIVADSQMNFVAKLLSLQN